VDAQEVLGLLIRRQVRRGRFQTLHGDAVPRLGGDSTARLEAEIDRFEAELAPLRHFILPGGSPGGAALHLARAVCRRAERLVVALGDDTAATLSTIRYLNRLSDHLFVAARYANARQGVRDVPWEGRAR